MTKRRLASLAIIAPYLEPYGALVSRVASSEEIEQRYGRPSPTPAESLAERIGRATRSNIGIDFNEPLEERYRGITAGLAPGIVRDKNTLPKGRGARRREAARKKGGK